jgi:hypothetical protein
LSGGGRWTIAHRYGAEELLGPGVAWTGRLCLAATVLAVAAVAALWWRTAVGHGEDVDADTARAALVLAAVLAMLATSRVLSPQYLVWAVAVCAVCATLSASPLRSTVRLVLLTALATQVEFPFVYGSVAAGSWLGVGILVVRNALLLWATGQAFVIVWRFGRKSKEIAGDSLPAVSRQL